VITPKIIAFYLPQFHPIPENDQWWGEGFTDWVNVRNAKPLYPGHLQPRIPHPDLGYYDPTDLRVLCRQAEMARAHGIHGFALYHYWFNGRLLLQRPVENFLASGEPDFPFCICWANEPWTRAWDGGEPEWRQHFEYLLPAWRDPRALRVDGKPVFLIYRIGGIPNAADMLRCWRRWAAESGLPGLHVVAMLTVFNDSIAFAGLGIDATCEFYPTYATRPQGLDYVWGAFRLGLHWRLLKRYTPWFKRVIIRNDYDYVWRRILSKAKVFPTQYRGAFVSWDNTPRKGHKGFIMNGVTPQRFGHWLGRQLERVRADTDQAPLLFLNAWNEWAEGAYLEPDQAAGYDFLRAAAAALAKTAATTSLAASAGASS
jgi:hypothetical protein